MSLPSIDDIESGECILFLGAGFSKEATSLLNLGVKSAWDLRKVLLQDSGEDDIDDHDLESAAEAYVKKFDELSISNLIHRNFQIKETTSIQDIVVCQPWHRIYTSNYDDLVEKSYSSNFKSFTVKEITDDVETPSASSTQLIHIYGNVTRISASEFKNKFLLSESQKDNSPFIKSP
jgi:hypothetical protein